MLIKKSTAENLRFNERKWIERQKRDWSEPFAWDAVNLPGFEEMEVRFLEREKANCCGICNEDKGHWGYKYVCCWRCQRNGDLMRRANEEKNNKELITLDKYGDDEPDKVEIDDITWEIK